jgi:hypothetical protein
MTFTPATNLTPSTGIDVVIVGLISLQECKAGSIGSTPFSRTDWLGLKHTAEAFSVVFFFVVVESLDTVEDI